MKLLIQIPCLNEALTLPQVLRDIPRSIPGIDVIETQIIDDGSTDETIRVAKQLGVTYILKNIGNKGLGNSFRLGIENAIQRGADILVNTDGDNQYPSRYISDLIRPILNQEAEIVVGDRQTQTISHFSGIKKYFQKLGTHMTLLLSGEKQVKDAVSGFRAYSKNALMQLNITSSFSYVLDSTIQAACKQIKVQSVPITTNAPTRPSRLFKNIGQHIWRSGIDLVRVYAMYKPLRVFIYFGLIFLVIGSIPMIRFLYDYFFLTGGQGKIQSLIFGATFILISSNLFALSVIGDLLSKNRTLIEHTLKHVKH